MCLQSMVFYSLEDAKLPSVLTLLCETGLTLHRAANFRIATLLQYVTL
jgi:hypothetical protein